MKKTTFFSRFFRETRFGLVISCFVIAGVSVQSLSAQTTYTAVASTAIDLATTWSSGSVPAVSDANIWQIVSGQSVTVTAAAVTFNGGTLDIPTGGILKNTIAAAVLTLNNLTLNGGKIAPYNNQGILLDLQTKTLTLNGGSLVPSTAQQDFVKFKNCSLAGSGNITIAQSGTGSTYPTYGYVELMSIGVITSGFTGTFIVAPGASGTGLGGTLKISAPTSGTFGVIVLPATSVTLNGDTYSGSVPGKLYFNPGAANTCTLASLTLGGTSIAPGVYTLAQLNDYAGVGSLTAYLNQSSTGTITIPAVAPNPPANVVATNVNGIASVTFTGIGSSFTVTPYDVTTSTAGTPVSGTVSPILLPGLNANDSYTFAVTATSNGLTSSATTSNPITITVPGTVTAVAGATTPVTNIYDLAAWSADNSIPIPVAGDANTWSTGAFRLGVSTSPYTFNGATFNVATGGVLSINIGSSALSFNNLILNGGIIQEGSSTSDVTVNLQTKTFTLNSGSIKTTSNSTSWKNLLFSNGSLAGSGTITISQIQAGTNQYYVEFLNTVNTTGFTGIFEVAPGLVVSPDNGYGGELKLNDIATATFGVKVLAATSPTSNGLTYPSTYNGKLYFTGTVNLASLNLGGTNIAPATYTLAQLNSYLGGDLSAYLNQASTGTVIVAGLGTGFNPLVQNKLVIVKDKGFQLNNNALSLQVYNSVGGCVVNRQNTNTSAFISIPNAGVYIVKAETDKGISVQKIIIL